MSASRLEQADAADEVLLAVALEDVAADVEVVLPERFGHVRRATGRI